MKYLALIYSAPGTSPEYGTPEFSNWMGEWEALHKTMTSDGIEFSGHPLQDTDTATSVRVRNGKTETMDGPFAETKEHLGGYYLLNCKDLDEAIKYAEMIPSAAHGTIEVRPVMDL